MEYFFISVVSNLKIESIYLKNGMLKCMNFQNQLLVYLLKLMKQSLIMLMCVKSEIMRILITK